MSRCVRDVSWIGRCKEEAVTSDPALCEKHAKNKCWCGAPAVRDCEIAGSLVCGAPLCADHGCSYKGHSTSGSAQYAAWKARSTPAVAAALSAHEQALKAAEAEREAEAARKRAEQAAEDARHREAYEAALPTLNEWFPRAEWVYYPEGNYGYDTILMEKGAEWSAPLKIKVQRTLIDMNAPEAGHRVRLYCVENVQDTSMPGHSYWSGPEVKSAADVGRWLSARLK